MKRSRGDHEEEITYSEEEMEGLIDIFNEQKETPETKNVVSSENSEATVEKEKDFRYREKLRHLQMFLPIIKRLLDLDPKFGLEDNIQCRKRLLSIYKLIHRPGIEKPVSYQGLEKIERILESIHGKYSKKAKREEKKNPSMRRIVDGYDSDTSPSTSSTNISQLTISDLDIEVKNQVPSEKVPIKIEPSSSKISLKIKDPFLKNRKNVFEPLFTPDRKVSKIRQETSVNSFISFKDSGYQRSPGSGGDIFRSIHSSTPRGEQKMKAPYPDTHKRVRAPDIDSGMSNKMPYLDSRDQYNSKSRYRPPYPDPESRYRPPYPGTELRYRHYPDPESRFKVPYRPIEFGSRYRAPNPDSVERHRGPRDAKFSSSVNKAIHRPRISEDTTRIVKYHGDDYDGSHHKPSFTDEEEIYYEKPKDVKQNDRTESSGPHSSRSKISSKTRHRDAERDEPPRKKVKEKNVYSSKTCTSSEDINMKSSFSGLYSLDDMTLEPTDIERLNQSTQQLKSNLNNRLKNMKAKRLLLASTKNNNTKYSDQQVMAAKDPEELIGIKNKVTQEKCSTKFENRQADSTSETTDAFIDSIMFNLTTKFPSKRSRMKADQSGKNSIKPETEVSVNINPDRPADVSSVVHGTTNSVNKGQDLNGINAHGTNMNMIRTPLLSKEDKAEVVSHIKKILAAERKKSMNLENEKKIPSVNDNSSLKTPVLHSIQNREDGVGLQTSPHMSVPSDDTQVDNIQIPGLDGVIPLTLNKIMLSSNEDTSNTTKDHSQVTTGLESGVSSHESSLKQTSNENETVQGSNIIGKVISNSNEHDGHQYPKPNSCQNDDVNKTKTSPSLRSKLSDEILTFHKVGTPSGGALRGRVERDKMMPSGQIASLKPGALFDLLGDEKPARFTSKAKTRFPMANPNNETHSNGDDTSKAPGFASETENSQPSSSIQNPDDIISKLSESDLRKIITENIEALPIPPNLPFLNNIVSTSVTNENIMNMNSSSSDVTWRNQINSLQPINDETQNVNMAQSGILLENASNNNPVSQQSESNWITYGNNIWDNKPHAKDPRQKSQFVTNVALSNHHNMENRLNPFRPIADAAISSFENPAYNSNAKSTTPYIGNVEPHGDNFYYNSSVVLQTDPLISPCYDGSATPDPYRTDPYTMSLNVNFEKQGQISNDSTEKLNVYSRPSAMGDSSSMFESHNSFGREVSQRPPLLGQRPPLLGQRSSLGNSTLSQDREYYSQQSHFYDSRNNRWTASTYAEWKAERNMAEKRNLNNFQVYDGSRHQIDKSISDHRGNNRYRWVNETATSSFNQQGNNYNEPTHMIQQKESEVTKKLSARDPRRRSIEDKFDRKESFTSSIQTSKLESNNENRPYKRPVNEYNCERSNQREPNIKDRTLSASRSSRRDDGRQYCSRDRSLGRGRNRSPHRERSPSRGSDSLTTKSRRIEKDQDTYLSPLEKLYAETPPPKTGLGYGFQKFRIPKIAKIHKGSFNHTVKPQNEESHHGKDNPRDNQSTDVSKKEDVQQFVDEEDPQNVKESEGALIDLEKYESKLNEDCDVKAFNSISDSEANNAHSSMQQSPEIKNQENSEQKPNTRSRSKENNSCDETVNDLELLPCRRSDRIITKKRKRGRPPKNTSVKEQINVDVEKEEKCPEIEHESQTDALKKKEDCVINLIDQLSDSKSMSNKTCTDIEMGAKILEPVLTEDERKVNQVNMLNTNTESNQSDLRSDENESTPLLNNTDQIIESEILPGIIPNHNTLSNDVSSPEKDMNVYEKTLNSIPNVQIPQNSDKIYQSPYDGNSNLTCHTQNDDTEYTITKKIEDGPLSGISHQQKPVEIPEAVGKLSEVVNESDNTCDADNKKPEIKIIKQMELLEDVIGIKLTPDKIRKVAELLYTSEVKENSKDDQQETQVSEANKLVEIIVSSRSGNVRENNETCGLQNLELSNEEKQENINQKPKRKYKNELDRLQDDISKYHDSEAIAAASGPRQCRLQKEKIQQPQNKINQNIKSKFRKYKEDIDDEQENSSKDKLAKSEGECFEEDGSCHENEQMKEKEEENSDIDRVETQNSESNSSDDINLYSEKMKTKYSFILEKPKEDQLPCEKNTSEARVDGEVKSMINTKHLESQRRTATNEGKEPNVMNIKENTEFFFPTSEDNNYSEIIKDACFGGKNANFNISTPCEPSNENLTEKESNSVTEDMPNKMPSHSELNKIGLKKQRKKSFWSAGIIKKKYKSKKTNSTNTNEDIVDKLELEIENQEIEDNDFDEVCDINYYQEGESKAISCKLCSYNGKSIVTHYAITHPKDEVLISRMSPEAAKIAIKESERFFSLCEEDKKNCSSLFQCRICSFKSPKFSIFFEHMALHTGEFRHECCKCGYRTSTRSGIIKHFQSHNLKNLNIKSCRVLYKEPVEKKYFCGYLCSLCNYFQISEKNVKRHVENIHEVQDLIHVIKINFSKVTLDTFYFNTNSITESSVGGISEKTLGNEKIEGLVNEKTDQVLEDNILGNQLESKTSTNEDIAENCNIVSVTNLEQVFDLSTTRKSVEGCINTNSTLTDLDILKDVNNISIMNESLHNDLSTSQNTSDPFITNNTKNSSENEINLQSSKVGGKLTESDISIQNENLKNNSVSNEKLVINSMLNEINDPPSKDSFLFNLSGSEEHCLGAVVSPKPTDKTMPETIGQSSYYVGGDKNQESFDPIKHKELQASMFMEVNWLQNLCEDITKMNLKYLMDNVIDPVLSTVEKLKSKSISPNISDQIIERRMSSAEDALSLNTLLETTVSFKSPRKSNVTCDENSTSVGQENNKEHEREEDIPTRRQLRERTCKGLFNKQTNDNESNIDENDDTEILELFKDMPEHDYDMEGDAIVREEIVPQTSTGELENFEIPHEALRLLPCMSTSIENYIIKNATRKSLAIEAKPYISSLPLNSNFSEFTHVMKQISQFSLKLLEMKEVKVGGLRAITDDGGLVFSCSLKIFNKNCGFQTSDLENFGQHVNMLHHTSYWNGICYSCKVHFVQDPNSHDKVSVNTQSKAFCHLVREHLIFTKKSSKSTSRGSLTTNDVPVSLEPSSSPVPRLRVRRFSGDKLSGTDAENILAKPVIEVSGQAEQENPEHALPLQHPVATCEDPSPAISMAHAETPLPLKVEAVVGIKTFKSPINIQGGVSTLKTENMFNSMCSHEKLRDLYKCMGMDCNFTTSSMKEFALHIDNHKETQQLNQGEGIQNDFWNVCAYCLTPHATSKDLGIHVRKEHAVCLMQCSNCFYRAKSIANVHFHHTVEHVGERFMVLLCDQFEINLPQYIEKPFTEFVSALRCNVRDTCSLFTYMLKTFCLHIMDSHPEDIVCHLCSDAFPLLSDLVKHYCNKHGMGMFQCLFCTFGACKEEDIRLHLCYAHANVDPKALQRTDNAPKQRGATNRESIKRIMFYKDQDKLTRFINFPPTGETQPVRRLYPEFPEDFFKTNKPTILKLKCPANLMDQHNTQDVPDVPVAASETNPPAAVLTDVPVEPTTEVLCSSDTPTQQCLNLCTEKTPNQNDNLGDKPSTHYFRCGNRGCDYAAENSRLLREHLMFCELTSISQKLMCPICDKEFKYTNKYLEHLYTHGPELYSCSLCSFKASRVLKVNHHMRLKHHFLTTSVVPVDRDKIDPEQDFFVVHGKEKRGPGKKPGPKGKLKGGTLTKFSPQELDQVPKAAIFMNPLGCLLCPFETKVRSNLIRHIQQHLSGDSVTQEEFVNPVPEKTEKMFDKMMNLAGSSHKKKPGPENFQGETPVKCPYKYVPDQDRYKCHVKDCGYRTLIETMLRDHISVIHKDESHYVCPHCIDELEHELIPIDQLSMHLKLHDSPVYKCAFCEFCSHLRRSIERHTEVVHPGEQGDVLVVRLFKPDLTVEQPKPALKLHTTDISDEQGKDYFCCNLCVFKTKKKKIILQHGITDHKMSKPFKCSLCGYESANEQIAIDHCRTYHSEEESQVISLYKKVTEIKKPTLPPIPPLWKRDPKRVKLIRGIKLDEKGDAPPPVATATTGIDGLDVLELKFGHFGIPLGSSFMCPRCSTSFVTKNGQDMKEHLYKDLDYTPIICKICKMGSTSRSKIMRHVVKGHNVGMQEITESFDTIYNTELESWVEKVLSKQLSLINEASTLEESRKRRRSSESSTVPAPPASSATTTSPPPESKTLVVEVYQIAPPNSDDNRGLDKKKRNKGRSKHRFSCEYCDVTTKFKHSITVHCKKVHPDMPPHVKTLEKTMDERMEAYDCMYCNCTALNMNILKHHWSCTHKLSGLNFLFRNTVVNKELKYLCYWCKKKDYLESLEEHIRDEHSVDQRFLVVSVSVPKYKCSLCSLHFKSVAVLKRHFLFTHPSRKFSYIVVNSKNPDPSSNQNSPTHSSQSDTPPQPTSIIAYECFNCPYASSRFWPVVKHMQEHFVTFVCDECSSWFPSAIGLKNHMLNKHPLSSVEPKILKGSKTDIENAKKNIIVISESGSKRKITEEELVDAENESKADEDCMYTYDEPLEVNLSPPKIKETARKSTGCSTTSHKNTSPLMERESQQKSPKRVQKELFNLEEESLNLDNLFATVKSNGNMIRLPSNVVTRLIDCEPDLILPNVT